MLETGGEIHQYAGDEVVITWRKDKGLREAGCIRCFFDIRAAIQRDAARYQRHFGVVPTFRGGLHGGPVTAGELGDLQRQIIFVATSSTPRRAWSGTPSRPTMTWSSPVRCWPRSRRRAACKPGRAASWRCGERKRA